jgi:hypothetical protein
MVNNLKKMSVCVFAQHIWIISFGGEVLISNARTAEK